MNIRKMFLNSLVMVSLMAFSGCATESASVEVTMTETTSDAFAAYQAALVYVNDHYDDTAPPLGLNWQQAEVTPKQLLGQTTIQYQAGTCEGIVSYPSAAPEAVIYQITIADRSSGFHWQGRVDPAGLVYEQIEKEVKPPDPAFAREAAMAYVAQYYSLSQEITLPLTRLQWHEEAISAEDFVGSSSFKYTNGDWEVRVSFPLVAPEATIYQVEISNQPLDFQWVGEVNATGQVFEGKAPGDDGNC